MVGAPTLRWLLHHFSAPSGTDPVLEGLCWPSARQLWPLPRPVAVTRPQAGQRVGRSCSSRATRGLAPTVHQHRAPHLPWDDAPWAIAVGRDPAACMTQLCDKVGTPTHAPQSEQGSRRGGLPAGPGGRWHRSAPAAAESRLQAAASPERTNNRLCLGGDTRTALTPVPAHGGLVSGPSPAAPRLRDTLPVVARASERL